MLLIHITDLWRITLIEIVTFSNLIVVLRAELNCGRAIGAKVIFAFDRLLAVLFRNMF